MPDLLASVLLTLLLTGRGDTPVYFSSPWISDFVLFSNYYREVVPLFPSVGERSEIRFVDFLVRLSSLRPVRIITTESTVSRAFLADPALSSGHIRSRFASREYHEKGILGPNFYIEGSMNITFSGVYVREEKVVYHSASDASGKEKIARAFLEFSRRWESLGAER